MSDVRDAEPGDIYIDATGKLWRVVGVCHEPTVIMKEIETDDRLNVHVRKTGGINGAMWNGWRRIWRIEAAAK